MQLGFAVWPLMRFTGEKSKMGEFVNRLWLKILGWTTAAVIIILNVKLLFDTFMPGVGLENGLRASRSAGSNNSKTMYQHILIPLENSATDRVILDHFKPLVRLTGGETAAAARRRRLGRAQFQPAQARRVRGNEK